MKKTIKRLASILMVATMIFSVTAISVSASDTSTTVAADDSASEIGAANTFSFDTKTTNWGNFKKVFCYVYNESDNEEFFAWHTKKTRCTDAGNGIWTFDVSGAGITLDSNKVYTIQFSNDSSSYGTYPLICGVECLGDTAYCDGTYYRGVGAATFWKNQDKTKYGPRLMVSSTGRVVGTCVPKNTTKYEIFTKFLKNGFYDVKENTNKSDQEIVDDVAYQLSLNKGDVERAINETSGMGIIWRRSKSCLPEEVKPTSVKLNATTAKRGVGESGTLTPILTPSNATTTYTWTSSNTKVATVSNGKVTAKKAGTATITVKTANGKTASCKVTVYNAPNSVKLNLTSAKLGVGESYTLKATLPANTYSRLAWSSSNTKVATVSNGKLVAKAKGTTTITVKTSNGKTATCKLTVYPAPTSVKLNTTSVTIGVGEKFTISETVNKGAYACTPNLKWSSANAKVAAIAKGKSNTAVITGKKAGTTTVKITLYNGKTATCKVTVKAAPASVKLNKTAITLKKGQKYTLTYGLNSGAYANPVNVKWSSNNTKGVTVAKGSANKCVVTAKNKGTATITVKTYNGKTAKCKVTVK